jgi:hypothetical protein
MQGRNLPLYPRYVIKHRTKLFSVARRQFGSWNKALLAAGLKKKHFSRMLPNSRRPILIALGNALEGSNADIPEALKFQAIYYFGSLRKAVFAAKNNREGWTSKGKNDTAAVLHNAGCPQYLESTASNLCAPAGGSTLPARMSPAATGLP